jgi:hypothetical protein
MTEFLQMYANLLGWIALHPIESFFVVLLQFFVVMKLHWMASRIKTPYVHELIHWPLVLWFWPQDVTVNLVLFTALGQEWPQLQKKEFTVTQRLKRWNKQTLVTARDRRQASIAWALIPIINWIDEGHFK